MTLLCCRHESSEADNLEHGGLQQVRVQNTKLGITTFWSLDKFQNNIAAMRELEQVSFKSVLTFQIFPSAVIDCFNGSKHIWNCMPCLSF